MKTLLLIFSHTEANPVVARHWPWYRKSGMDIVGVGSTNGNCIWPQYGLLDQIKIGSEGAPSGAHYIHRFLNALSYCLSNYSWLEYESFCFIEYDGIFLKPLPEIAPNTFVTKKNGGASDGFLGSFFVHTPWIMDRQMGHIILDYGQRMYKHGLHERGFLDRWFGLMIDLYKLNWSDLGRDVFSENTLDTPHLIQMGRDAAKRGVFYIHGIKTQKQLEAVTGAIQ